MKKRLVCFISAHLPAPDARQAGQKMAYHRLKWLSYRYSVHLITFANKDELEHYNAEYYSMCDDAWIIPVTTAGRIKGLLQNLNLPLLAAARSMSEVKECLSKYYSSSDDIVFWYEFDQMCQYIPAHCGPKKKNIVLCHDVLWQMFERRAEKRAGLAKFLFSYERDRVEKWEAKVLKRCDSVLAVSAKDAEILRNKLHITNVEVSYPKIEGYNTEKAQKESKQKRILFFGAMNRAENEEAVVWFLDNIWQILHEMHSDLSFTIVGSNPQKSLYERCKNEQQIEITGFVDDPAPYFAEALFSVAPLQMGAGVKIKVLECMASSLPVVATSIGAEGIGAEADDGLLVSDTIEGYQKLCLDLLADTEKCKKLHFAAKQWFKIQYEPHQETAERIYRIVEGEVVQ